MRNMLQTVRQLLGKACMDLTWPDVTARKLRRLKFVLLVQAVIHACLPSSAWAGLVQVVFPDRSATLPIVTVAGRPYLDARRVVELVSGRLQVVPARGHAAITVGARTLLVNIGSPLARISDRVVTMGSAPLLQGHRVLLPVELLAVILAERYGQDQVDWNANQRVARVRFLDPTIHRIRVGTYPSHSRVVLDTAGPLEWSVQSEDGGSVLRILVPGGVLAPSIHPLTLSAGIVRAVQPTQQAGGAEVKLLRERRNTGLRSFALRDPDRIVIDVLALPAEEEGRVTARASEETPSPSAPDSPLPRAVARSDPPVEVRPVRATPIVPEQLSGATGDSAALSMGPGKAGQLAVPREGKDDGDAGRLTVVLDPGHGGHDTGAVGPTGLAEKDVVLDLALRLSRLLQDRLGIRVIMTRTEDVFVPLQERTAIANRAKADFFLSLHVNGASKRGAVGFETFFFTREPSDSDARASAQRENLVIETDDSRGKDQESLLRITLADMAVTRDIRESSELAEMVLGSLDKLLKVDNRGVKSGPFYVLATAAMPAILVESAFITNPKEERRLQREQYRQRVAEALFQGIAEYKARYERRVGMRRGSARAADS